MTRYFMNASFFLLGALFVPSSHSADKGIHKELRIGVITEKPDKMIKEYTPLANYIAERLKEFGIKGGTVISVPDVHKMLVKIQQGEVDMVFESAFSTIEMEREGMLPAALVWRKGVREYRTVFFVRKESPIQTLQDLKGKTIVFEDPHSTSAYLMPRAEMKKQGLHVAPINSDAVQGDSVRYSFAGGELNQAFWVVQKRANAGVFNNNDWEELPEKVKAELRIIHETRPFLRYICSFHPHVPVELREAIINILVKMHLDPAGRKILNNASRVKKIERLSDADFPSLDYVRSLVKFSD